ncbi:MAG: SRPBCC family protein, partial [Novosphingobium sp.]|nr:SRPBCC family protein [Novosphingobium sp.]
MRRFGFQAAAIGLAGLLAQPLHAEVTDQFDNGFAIALSAETTAGKSDAWKMLTAPAQWWSSEHTWSGDAANLYIDSQATGCFCEKLPRPADAPEGQRMGSVEHGHIVYADPQRGVLRLIGGLGPLQS